MDRTQLPDADTEIKRYQEHHNDPADYRYQRFVSPIVDQIMANHTPDQKGLDFGSGTGPVISMLLENQNYAVNQYDPFFYNRPELLTHQYDYIACCEVIEHFHHPEKEFALLKKILAPKGRLYCMTAILYDHIDFSKWYYKNDFTHVFFYRPQTLQYICKCFGFNDLHTDHNLIRLSC